MVKLGMAHYCFTNITVLENGNGSQRLEEDRLPLGAVDFYSSQTMLAVIYHSMSAYECMHLFTVCIHVY